MITSCFATEDKSHGRQQQPQQPTTANEQQTTKNDSDNNTRENDTSTVVHIKSFSRKIVYR